LSQRTNRGGAAFGDQPVEHRDGGVGVDPAGDGDRQRLAGVLVHDMQLEDPAIGGLVELVVQCPRGRDG